MEIFEFKDKMGRTGECGLLINKHEVHYIIVCTELNNNSGPSVTNAAEEIATQVCKKRDLFPNRIVWVERYEANPGEASIVTFKWDQKSNEFCSPVWRNLTLEEAEELDLVYLLD